MVHEDRNQRKQTSIYFLSSHFLNEHNRNSYDNEGDCNNIEGCAWDAQDAQDIAQCNPYVLLNNVVCDFREPNIFRVAPTPLYNSYIDVYQFVMILKKMIYG